MQALLSFDKAPPFAAPLRFFLTAPLFAVAAALLLLVAGPEMLASRWSPGLLAATHLVTVGFMLQVMLGALIQILPVVAGANLPNPLAVARWLHAGLGAGTLLLAGGFLVAQPALLGSGAALLAAAVAAFLAATARALAGVPSTSPTIRGLKISLAGLAGTVALGSLLAFALASGWALSFPAVTDLHAGWGLGAWAGVLLAAMAYVVVPMFQLTPGYPARPGWAFPVAMLGLVIVWTLAVATGVDVAARGAQALLAFAGMAFAALTMRLQSQRRRARADATLRFWQFGLGCVILALLMTSTATVFPVAGELPGWGQAAGILLVVGGFVSFIAGMLYKIVPFLAWLHLQNLGGAKPAPPVNRLLADADAQRQAWVHFAGVTLLLAATVHPDGFSRPAALVLALSGLWLFRNLLLAVRRYNGHRAVLAGPP